jgi:hypothetical protein
MGAHHGDEGGQIWEGGVLVDDIKARGEQVRVSSIEENEGEERIHGEEAWGDHVFQGACQTHVVLVFPVKGELLSR